MNYPEIYDYLSDMAVSFSSATKNPVVLDSLSSDKDNFTSFINAMFVVSMCAVFEADLGSGGFLSWKTAIPLSSYDIALDSNDILTRDEAAAACRPAGRVAKFDDLIEALYGIRIAFTHSNGLLVDKQGVNQITEEKIAMCEKAVSIFSGVAIIEAGKQRKLAITSIGDMPPAFARIAQTKAIYDNS